MPITRTEPGTTKVELFDVTFHLLNMTTGQKLNLHQKTAILDTTDANSGFDEVVTHTAAGIVKIEDGEKVYNLPEDILNFMLYIDNVSQLRTIMEAVWDHNNLEVSEAKN